MTKIDVAELYIWWEVEVSWRSAKLNSRKSTEGIFTSIDEKQASKSNLISGIGNAYSCRSKCFTFKVSRLERTIDPTTVRVPPRLSRLLSSTYHPKVRVVQGYEKYKMLGNAEKTSV